MIPRAECRCRMLERSGLWVIIMGTLPCPLHDAAPAALRCLRVVRSYLSRPSEVSPAQMLRAVEAIIGRMERPATLEAPIARVPVTLPPEVVEVEVAPLETSIAEPCGACGATGSVRDVTAPKGWSVCGVCEGMQVVRRQPPRMRVPGGIMG